MPFSLLSGDPALDHHLHSQCCCKKVLCSLLTPLESHLLLHCLKGQDLSVCLYEGGWLQDKFACCVQSDLANRPSNLPGNTQGQALPQTELERLPAGCLGAGHERSK